MTADAAVQVTTLLDTLAADLAKAEPQHFSIGLMVLRIKEIQAAATNLTDTPRPDRRTR